MNREGWICPRCQQVNAPWMPTCSCNPGTGIGITKPFTLPWVKLPIPEDSRKDSLRAELNYLRTLTEDPKWAESDSITLQSLRARAAAVEAELAESDGGNA